MRNPFRKKRWDEIIFKVLALPKHTDLKVRKSEVLELPLEFEKRLGEDDGQIADYGLALEDGAGIHVKEYDADPL